MKLVISRLIMLKSVLCSLNELIMAVVKHVIHSTWGRRWAGKFSVAFSLYAVGYFCMAHGVD